jgi:hypothetical protein
MLRANPPNAVEEGGEKIIGYQQRLKEPGGVGECPGIGNVFSPVQRLGV